MELLSRKNIDVELSDLSKGWKTNDYIRIEKEFFFNDFQEALNFTNYVGAYSEEIPHHPTITVSYGQAIVTISTNDIGGLSELDFQLAKKIDRLNLDKDSLEISKNIAILKNGNDFERRKAASKLGKIGDIRVVSLLIKKLNDKDPFVRKASAISLGKIGNKKAVYPLATKLSHDDDDLSYSARDALINIGQPSVRELLSRINNRNAIVRRRAVIALGEIGDKKSILNLVPLLNDEDEGVRWRAARYLKTSWNADVVQILRKIIKNDNSKKVREEASITLNKIEEDVRRLLPIFKKGIKAISDEIDARPLNSGGISYYSPERKFLYMAIYRSNPYKVRVELYQGNKRFKELRTMKGTPEWGVIDFQNKNELNTVLEASKKSYITIKELIRQV